MEKTLPLEERSIYQIYLESQEAKTYMIPVYQRPYSWGEKQVKQLLTDIDEAYDHYKKQEGGNADALYLLYHGKERDREKHGLRGPARG